jgi:hypothetical protein
MERCSGEDLSAGALRRLEPRLDSGGRDALWSTFVQIVFRSEEENAMRLMSLLPAVLWIAGACRAQEVTLRVVEPVGAVRAADPVSTGVCFKPGQVSDTAKLALFSADGKPVPAQFLPLVRLEDGSLQWVLADFQADVPANGNAGYVVKAGKSAAHVSPVVVSEKDGIYTLNNGPLKVVIDAASPVFDLIHSIAADGQGKISGLGADAMTCRDALDGNKVYHAGKPAKVGFDYRGPMRTTLMLEGPYVDAGGAEWLGYRVRVTVYAGRKLVRIEHELRNSCPTAERHVKVKDAHLRLGLAGSADVSTGTSWLVADGVFVKHRLLSGYFTPALHELGVKDGRLTMAVVPVFEGGYDPKGHRGYNKQEEGAEYNRGDTGSWWLVDCAYKIDEYWLDLGGGDASLADALDNRLYALADSAYYSDCDALGFGRFGDVSDEESTYKKWGWGGIEEKKRDLLGNRWMKAMPEYHVASVLTHDDSETDDAEGCLLLALRTGGRGYWDAGLAWARLYCNYFVQRIDFDRSAKRAKGPNWKLAGRDNSDIVRWGNSYINSRTCGCHFYGAGWGSRGFGRQFMAAVRWYQINRDEDSKKRMVHMAELALNDPSMIRQDGWIALHSGGSNSMEKKHVSDQIQKLPRLREFMDKNGISWDENTSTASNAKGDKWPVYDMAGSWEQTYVQQGMHRYWRATGDRKAAEYVVGFAEFFHKCAWNPHCEQVGYRLWGVNFPTKDYCLGSQAAMFMPEHDNCPAPGASHDGWYTRFGPDVAARAFDVSGDRKYLDQARVYWNRGSKRGYHTTGYSAPDDQVGRFAQHNPPKDDDMLATGLMFYLAPRMK